MEYTIKNDKLTVVLRSFGGQLHSIKREGIEYLWQGDPAWWNGQAPVLFPICGSIRDDKAEIGENLHTSMPRHGLIRKREFEAVDVKDDSVAFQIDSNDEMLQSYPYRFSVGIRYTLKADSIEVRYSIKNTDEKTMPFQIGGHPAFNCPLIDGEDFEDYEIRFDESENCTMLKNFPGSGLIDIDSRKPLPLKNGALSLTHELFSDDALTLDGLKSQSVSLVSAKSGAGVTLSFSDFPYLVLWSAAGSAPFAAIEPWTGISTCSDEDDVFEHKRNIQQAEPGEEKIYRFTITPLAPALK